jgi:hypothetical protein
MKQPISPGPAGLKAALDETTIGLEFLPVPGKSVVVIQMAAVLDIKLRRRQGWYQPRIHIKVRSFKGPNENTS